MFLWSFGTFDVSIREDNRKHGSDYAYIGARYDMNYVITEDELTWLAEKVVRLHELTERDCENEIELLGREE